MFDLNEAIVQWRAALKAQPNFRGSDLDELEDHLREEILALKGSGLTEEEIFLVSSRRLGKPEDLNGEFAIADPATRRNFRLRWMVTGALALIFLWLATDVLTNFGAGAMSWIPGPNPSLASPGRLGGLIGVIKLLSVGMGALLIWRWMATDHSSRRLRSLSGGAVVAVSILLAFLVLATRMGSKIFLVRDIPQEGLLNLSMASAWINLFLMFLLPAILLIGLWRLVRS